MLGQGPRIEIQRCTLTRTVDGSHERDRGAISIRRTHRERIAEFANYRGSSDKALFRTMRNQRADVQQMRLGLRVGKETSLTEIILRSR